MVTKKIKQKAKMTKVSAKVASQSNADEALLAPLRLEINAIDAQLLTLMNRRADLALEIGHIKQGGVKYRPEREADVLRRIQKANQGPLANNTVAMLFREVMSACLALESPLSVAYLGPPGTFSEAASNLHFGHAAQLKAQPTISDALRAVELKNCHFAVVPVENSSEGAVGAALDLLITTPLRACGETILPVHHHLLTHAKSLRSIKSIAAHPQALGQCARWIQTNLPNAQAIPTVSNASAAKMASEQKNMAAIAGDSAAEIYTLPKLATNIEDSSNNTTRFLVMGHLDTAPTGDDKTSLIVSAKNVPGAVHRVLTPLVKESVSMTRLESRPAPVAQVGGHRLWEYVFFMDIEGHAEEPSVKRALKGIEKESSFIKVLGSYPRSALSE